MSAADAGETSGVITTFKPRHNSPETTSFLLVTSSQDISTNSVYWPVGNSIQNRQDISKNIQIPNYLATGVQIVKQVPYVEILKLVEAFLKLKGEVAGRAWSIVYDNAHILAALRDTLISKISTVHALTLNALIILRKVLEFAGGLFSTVHINVGDAGPFVDKAFAFGR